LSAAYGRLRLQGLEGDPNGAARAGGFSLHAGVGVAQHQREKFERRRRHVSRLPVASVRMHETKLHGEVAAGLVAALSDSGPQGTWAEALNLPLATLDARLATATRPSCRFPTPTAK
jgi:hypothetical protein